MAKLPKILMPDPDKLPEGLTLSAPMVQNYKTLPDTYESLWKSFGEDPTESKLPEEMKVPGTIKDPEKSGISSYASRVGQLESQFERLRGADEQVATAVERTVEYCEAGKADISSSVTMLGELAAVHPENDEMIQALLADAERATIPVFQFPETYVAQGDFTEDNYVLSLIEGATGGMESIMNSYSELFAALEKPEPPEDDLDDPGDPGNPGNPYGPGDPGAPGSPELENTPLPSPEPIDLGESDDAAGTDTAGQADDAARDQLDQLGRDAAAAGAGAPGAGMAGTPGSGLESMMLPMMMQAMMGNMMNQRDKEAGDPRRPRAGEPGQNVPAPAPAPAAPAANTPQAPAAQQPPGRAAVPAAGQGQPGTAGKPSGASEGNVVYTFPDGRTQEVSAVVAQALDAAFDNAAATDAKAAYAKTPKKWMDEKDVGARVDPHQLMTGDVGFWEDRTALLVAFDTETSGTLEAVVDGELKPVVGPEDMRDGQGEFGAFIGFFHPPGIEKAADDSAVPATDTATPPPDQSVAAAPA